jgi:hypothetical protein
MVLTVPLAVAIWRKRVQLLEHGGWSIAGAQPGRPKTKSHLKGGFCIQVVVTLGKSLVALQGLEPRTCGL